MEDKEFLALMLEVFDAYCEKHYGVTAYLCNVAGSPIMRKRWEEKGLPWGGWDTYTCGPVVQLRRLMEADGVIRRSHTCGFSVARGTWPSRLLDESEWTYGDNVIRRLWLVEQANKQ